MKRQTSAPATAMVNADYEWLSENPSHEHRAPRDRTVPSRKQGNYEQAGGGMSMPILGSRPVLQSHFIQDGRTAPRVKSQRCWITEAATHSVTASDRRSFFSEAACQEQNVLPQFPRSLLLTP